MALDRLLIKQMSMSFCMTYIVSLCFWIVNTRSPPVLMGLSESILLENKQNIKQR